MAKIDVVVQDPNNLVVPMGGGGPRPTVEEFTRRAPEIAEGLVEIADLFEATLDQRSADPEISRRWTMDEVGMSFGLGLEVGAGLLIARGAVSSTFDVNLVWRRRHAR
jgi:hypothetical protein